MSSGTQLQEMEVGTKESKGPVNANAAPGDKALPAPLSDTPGNKPLISSRIIEVPLFVGGLGVRYTTPA